MNSHNLPISLLKSLAEHLAKCQARNGVWIPSGSLYTNADGQLCNKWTTWYGKEALKSATSPLSEADAAFVKNEVKRIRKI